MSYGMDGWNHDNDLVRRKDVMDSLVKEYNRRFSLGERNGLKLAWIEKAVNEVDVAQQGKIQLPEEDATKGATSDLISRAAAIDELNKGAWGVEWDKTLAKTMIESLPSAQPERKRGKWLREIGAYLGGYPRFRYHCSVCGNVEEHVYADSKCANFCPNCGADMREVDDERSD